MIAPVLPELAIRALQVTDDAGLIHRATRGLLVDVPGPGGSRVKTWTYPGAAVPARLNPLSAEARERAGAPASSQLYTLALPAGTTVAAGDRWSVVGTTSGEDWTREVLVQREGFPKSEESRRVVFAIDVKSNP